MQYALIAMAWDGCVPVRGMAMSSPWPQAQQAELSVAPVEAEN